jgi:amino acid adenylation domain-containing protein/non-ribosomal peptide synthase protein (TIGR01720 family)
MVKAQVGDTVSLSPRDRAPVDLDGHTASPEFPLHRCVHQLFEDSVARTPDAVALMFGDQRLTYRELNRYANRLAHQLRTLGLGPEGAVGLLIERSPAAVIGRLAALKAGAAYVPLDPRLPPDRLAFMLRDAGVRVLLAQSHLRDFVPPAFAGCIIDPDDPGTCADSDDNPDTGVTSANLAYIIYTSGSTGQPKGVLIEHRALTNVVCAQISVWGIQPHDRVIQYLSLSFDASQAEIFRTLAAGATLCVPPPDMLPGKALVHYLREHGVTFFTTVPSTLAALPTDVDLPALHTLTLGGEALPAELAAFWRQGGRRLFNGYGPTETTVGATLATDWDPAQPPPLGKAIPNMRVVVLDDQLRHVPTGAAGEIHIAGVGVARGYLRQPEATALKFLPDPFSGVPGARMYKSGDLARCLPDGDLEFLGRVDGQVKIRGHRIELSEIETALGLHPNVRHGVVVARELGPGHNRLVAYVVAHHPPAPSAQELRRYLHGRLPDYMVPAFFVFLPQLPLTANGKADRQALPAPEMARPELDREFVPPRNAAEQRIAEIWAELLQIGQVGVHDGFFDLGGNSLLATQAAARIAAAFQTDVPLRALFEEPTVAALAARIEAFDSQAGRPKVPPFRRAQHVGEVPLSFAQHRLWFTDRMAPGNPLYNLPAALRVQGRLNTPALERAVQEIVRRHEILRTTFNATDSGVTQLIHPSLDVTLSVHDLRDVPLGEREDMAAEIAKAEAVKPFDLTRGPLLRPVLVRIDDDDHLLLLTMHHVVCDAWSMSVLTREWAALYDAFADGRRSPLPEPAFQYADFAVWQRQWVQGEVLEAQLEYWKQRLANLPHALDLPTDKPRPPVQRFSGAQHLFCLPSDLSAELEQLSRMSGATPYMLLLAAYQILLSRYSGQADLAVGTPVAGRNRVETENLLGFFVNVLVLRADLSGDPTFRQFLQQVRETCLEAFAHQDAPFERLVNELSPQRDLSRNPLFQAAFIWQNAPSPTLTARDITLTPVDVDQGTSKADLSLAMTPTPHGLEGRWVYNPDLFEAATIRRMTDHLRVLLRSIAARPDDTVTSLPMLTQEEHRQIVIDWNATAVDLPRDRSVHELFEARARLMPDAIALVCEGQALSYGQLNRRANHLARRLKQLGIAPEVRVALCLERSVEAVIGVLAVLKAGGVYVPLDPAAPHDRLALMLADTQPRVLLTQRNIRAKLGAIPGEFLELDLYRTAADATFSADDDLNPTRAFHPDALAYIIYTSGSTGRPKGAMVSHRGLTNVIQAQIRAFEIGPGLRLPQFLAIHFDAAQGEIFRALVAGATLYQAPPEMVLSGQTQVDLLARQNIELVAFPPSVLGALEDEHLRTVRTLILAGEAAPPELAARWAPGRQLWNAYGPTETTICATLATGWDLDRPPPIGRPIANTQAYVLDKRYTPVPVGVPGELHVGGEGVGRGYLNLPDLTAAVFVPDPFGDIPGGRLYKTGDLVRWRPDGNLEFLGRTDHQVKIRGFRIELGEIEARLKLHSNLQDAVVAARVDRPGSKQLVGYVVPRSQPAPAADELRTYLAARLPEYMVPATFVFLDALPCFANGKVNRNALPAPDRDEHGSARAFLPPRNDAERVLAEIWAAVLQRPSVSIDDNFFALGGDSISSIQVIARANKAGFRLGVKDLFQHQTVAELAAAVPSPTESASRAQPRDLDYWRAMLTLGIRALPVDFSPTGPASPPASLTVALTEAETGKLEQASQKHSLRTEEVLLAALLQSVETWTGYRSLLVDVEIPVPSAKEDSIGTVATAAGMVKFPLRLDLQDAAGIDEMLRAAKEQMRSVPHGGRGYAALALSSDEALVRMVQGWPTAQLCFRYRPNLEQGPAGDTRKSYHLQVDASCQGHQMVIQWTYRPDVYENTTVRSLASVFLERLRALLDHCQRARTEGITAADLVETGLSRDDLEQLLSEFSSVGEDNLS